MTEEELRQIVRDLYGGCCGYCGVHETEVGSDLEVDHFQPRSAGGSSDLDNLVYCCTACNRYKGDFWPQLPTPRRLLHPRHDNLTTHLRAGPDGLLAALTEIGAFHIERLHLNRPPLVALRRRRADVRSLRERLAAVEAEQARSQERITALEQSLQHVLDQIDHLNEA